MRPIETQEMFYQRKKILKSRVFFDSFFLSKVFVSRKLNLESVFLLYFIILNSK